MLFGTKRPARNQRVSNDMRSGAVARALDFLLRARQPDGWWRDFETLAGPSDEWVTGYVAYSIAGIPNGSSAARKAYALLKARCRDGFGYNADVPPDCDSTAWFCRLAEKLDETGSPEYTTALRFLRSSIRSNGGLPTYPSSGPIRQFTKLPANVSFQGWNSTHTCVTAAATALMGMRDRSELRTFLRSVRTPEGDWRGYWWTSRAYPTMLAAGALGADARRWAECSHENSAFGLACRLSLGASVLARLLGLQQKDGSWPPSAELRIPGPGVLHPDRSHCRTSLDKGRLYTTATAIRALHELR